MEALLASLAAAGIAGIVAFAIYALHAIRADFTGPRAEVADLREQVRQGFAEVRAEIALIDRATR